MKVNNLSLQYKLVGSQVLVVERVLKLKLEMKLVKSTCFGLMEIGAESNDVIR